MFCILASDFFPLFQNEGPRQARPFRFYPCNVFMKRIPILLLWLILLLLQTGCVYVPSRETATSQRPRRMAAPLPAPTPLPSPAPRKELQRAQPSPTPSTTRPLVQPYVEESPYVSRETTPALLALLSDADRQLGSGQLDNAATTLERAIRIKPKSAELWHRMARLRLQQHQPGQAENLAKKSNVLAKGDRDLTRRNLGVIAQARRQLGDQSGAAEADARAAQ